MTPEGDTEVRLPGVDLVRTVVPLAWGRRGATVRVVGGAVHRASRTPEGPVAMALVTDGEVVRAHSWGPGSAWATAHLPDLLGLHDDPASFRPADPVLRRIQARHPGERIGRSGRILEALLPAILGQRVTGKEATRAWNGIVARFGESAPGPLDLMLPPTPDRLAHLGYFEFSRFLVDRTRAETIQRACSVARRLEEAAAMSTPDAFRRLMAVPGIGPWTAALTIAYANGDPDVVVLGDYNLPAMVAWNLARERDADDARMLELLAPYEGHRWRVIRMLKTGGEKMPRRGPRFEGASRDVF